MQSRRDSRCLVCRAERIGPRFAEPPLGCLRQTGMDDYDRAAYLEDGMDPDDPTVIANHEFMLAALWEYGRRVRRCPPVLPNESGGHRTI